jgi:GH15 family glucan-1,4-alpha-glucosidase/NAD(P)-dependent dehydrogenase (short-subunit alcohol dehydrogenase family)
MNFPPIAHHGVIGDRRTAALVADDGTLDWFCVPDFDGASLFGSLLDPARGGLCRWGAAGSARQRYLEGTTVVLTTWDSAELADVMAWPADERPEPERDQRVIIRRLRATRDVEVEFELCPRRDFHIVPDRTLSAEGHAVFSFKDGALSLWASFAMDVTPAGARATLSLSEGDQHWVVLGWNSVPSEWSARRAEREFEEAARYWRDWTSGLTIKDGGARGAALRRAAVTVHLLGHAHQDCAVAAVTMSLPERLGGDRNYDYRYAWVRDASLSLALLARMGMSSEIQHYLEWLCGLLSPSGRPLQVCYRLDGNPNLEEEEIPGVCGYENSRPVHRGNRAAGQLQLGSMGFLADCVRIYLDHGGEWRPEFWQLIKRVADFTCEHWREKDSGVWELSQQAHYVASRVMSWVVLERAMEIAARTGAKEETAAWKRNAEEIHAEVMDKGWCEEKNAFRQRYGSDTLDAAALLIPLMNFLPADHPRVVGTLSAIERELVVDGMVHRFDPTPTLGGEQLPLGEFEGAFLPAVFWHVHALARVGRCDQAEAILKKCEAIAGEMGLYAEEADVRQGTFLGNTPLLFSHVEYARAVMELNEAKKKIMNNRQPRVIVITGASAGVGRATARMFAKTEKAHIALIARGFDGLEGAKHDVEALGGRAIIIQCDVADAAVMEAAAERVERELGPIDVWVNDAMTSVFSFIKDMTPEDFKRVTEVCYLGFVNGTLAALKRMLPRNRGHIIQVGSALAYRGIPLQAAYCASKHAIQGFMDSLRAELIHDHSAIVATMVQMPALNTPQFGWCKSRLPNKVQPVPPIYQPEIAASAIVYASRHRRRSIYVGLSTFIAIIGNKMFPGLGDLYLGRTGVKGQQTGERADPDKPNNLYEPVAGDHGAHGAFDSRSHGFSPLLWTDLHRDWIIGGLLVAAVAAAAALRGQQREI